MRLVTQSCPTLSDPMDTWSVSCQAPLSFGDSPGKNTGMGCHALLQGNLPNPGIEPRSPAMWADCLPSEALGKPQNTGVGSLSLLQWNFPTQVLNQGFLHWRQILYQLSYPNFLNIFFFPSLCFEVVQSHFKCSGSYLFFL